MFDSAKIYNISDICKFILIFNITLTFDADYCTHTPHPVEPWNPTSKVHNKLETCKYILMFNI